MLLSSNQVQEVKKLRAEDPKLWTVIALSRMLEVKPLAILYVHLFLDLVLSVKEFASGLEYLEKLRLDFSSFSSSPFVIHVNLLLP